MDHRNIALRLIENGFQAFLVGGAVRDVFLGREPKDFDLATNARPDEILRLFPEGKQVGASFPVVLVEGIEVATFRTETATGRHEVDFILVNTIEEDLARRDFTINAMAVNMATMETVDPFNGLEDLKAGRIKFVGSAKERILEDPLRMLRAVRFATRFGFTIAPFDLEKMRAPRVAGLLRNVSHERRRMELEQIIMSDDPAAGIRLLKKARLLVHILPEIEDTFGVVQNRHHADPVFEHLVASLDAAASMRTGFEVRMAALLHDIGKPLSKRFSEEKNDFTFHGHEVVSGKMTANLMKRMRFDTATAKRVEFLVAKHMFFFTAETRDSRLRKLMAEAEDLGLNIRDLMRVRLADRKGNLAKATRSRITFSFRKTIRNIRRLEREDAALRVTDLAVSGHDVMNLGFEGPDIGAVLRAAFEEVAEERIPNEKEAILKFMKNF